MRFNPIPLMAAIMLTLSMSAQDDARYRVLFRGGTITPSANITDEQLSGLNRQLSRAQGQSVLLVQFEKIPDQLTRASLAAEGIRLLDYIPNQAYLATVTGLPSASLLRSWHVRAVMPLTAAQKMQEELWAGRFPPSAVKIAGTVDVWLSIPASFDYEAGLAQLRSFQCDILSTSFRAYGIVAVRLNQNRLRELAEMPFVEFVQAAPGEDQPLLDRSTVNSRANILRTSFNGGRDLRGQGVVIGVGDDANPLRHLDFSGRLINRAAIAGGAHGVHVSGIVGGGGILIERVAGFAPKATILQQSFSNILTNAPAYIQDHGMVITNNSYGNIVNECSSFGLYSLYSRVMDQQSLLYDQLQHVFAAGNSGNFSCSPYVPGFGTVLGDYQSSKNVLSVGNGTDQQVIWTGSSKGPVKDGRIKPEISAQGTLVASCWPTNIYTTNTGTSMASPAVAGGLALLYQRYRQLNGNANPKNGLIKALLLNGAVDKGNPGPDYSYGFGWMNVLRSVKMLEQNNYFTGQVANAATHTHAVTVPPNTAALKVMLYWNDPAASVLSAKTLVNDLDLEVVDPSSNVYLPFVLDTVPANVNNPAGTGVDRINNVEQVVLNNPPAGSYTLRVKGTAIPQPPDQEYYLVYDTIPVSLTLTYPSGGEKLRPGESIFITWDAFGGPANTFTLEYSLDNGSNWTLIDANVSASASQYSWTVPNTFSGQARVRISRNSTALVQTGLPFVILGAPAVSLDAVQCEGYIKVNWAAIGGATDYEVMRLQGDEMIPVGTTAGTTYTIGDLSKDTTYVVAVRARINGSPGTRDWAVIRQPNSGTCAGNISDNDIKLDSILAPAVSGRLLTSTAFGTNESIRIRIKNLDDAPTAGNITASYSINGGPLQTDVIVNPAIAAGGTLDHTFTTTADLSAAGLYNIVVSLSYIGDPMPLNNTQTRSVRQLNNPAISLASPFLDDLEAATQFTYYGRRSGFSGLDRYDFTTNTNFGRVRSFLNTGIAYSGSKALTLDADRYNAGGTTDSLTGTFNLAGFDPAVDDIRLDFRFKNHGQANNAANAVWIRGNDQQSWIPIYNLFANQPPANGSYKKTASLELSDSLLARSQGFSSSFQVRWGQWGLILAADNNAGAGYTFDDIRIYKAIDDVEMVSIDTPIVNSCNLSAATPVRITVRNNSNLTLNNVPVTFSVDGGAFIAPEQIASIPANSSVVHTFTATANLALPGSHTLSVKSLYPTDNFNENDTLSVALVNLPLITVTGASPYLQDFEASEGYWYAAGSNSSWEYGTPASQKIKRAASGSRAWKTRLTGNYNDIELSRLHSPCFDLSACTNPTLSFSVALDLEDCGGSFCDGAYAEYSLDGKTWSRLGANGQGTNWYNKTYAANNLWSVQNYTRWHVATIPLSVIPVPASQLTQLRLRFVVSSDAGVNREGMAVDDIHLYDNVSGIYDGPTMGAPVTAPVPGGTGWVHFLQGGKLVASVNSPVVNMGSTDAQAYINTGGIRVSSSQYYHNRNITIKPANISLGIDSATVRFYFLDSETEALLNATGCGYCSKPAMAYELGVTKYSDPDDNKENGTLNDNTNLVGYSFITPSRTRIIPFDKGYYAEFKVRDFSEFWLNNGGVTAQAPLPLQLLSFNAVKRANGDVWCDWRTANEQQVSRFEIEVARGNEAYGRNQFVKLGELPATGSATAEQDYRFVDKEAGKTGVRYYRLRMVDADGRFSYSPVRPVQFGEAAEWIVYPNPSNGVFFIQFQSPAGQLVKLRVVDAAGRQVLQNQAVATGFEQKTYADLSDNTYASGLYLLEVWSGDRKQTFRLLKQ